MNNLEWCVLKKRILLLTACRSSDEPLVYNGICKQAKLCGIESGRNNND